MNVALASATAPLKRPALLTENQHRSSLRSLRKTTPPGDVISPPSSTTSPIWAFASSPEDTPGVQLLAKAKKAAFDFKKSGHAPEKSPPAAEKHVSRVQFHDSHERKPVPEIEPFDDVDAPIVIDTTTWMRPYNLTQKSITDYAAISPHTLKAEEVRANSIDWKTYLQSRVITQDHFDCLIVMEKCPQQQRDHLLAHHGAQCARLLVEMATNISQPAPIQYILTMIDDFLHEDRNRVQAFHQYAWVMRKNTFGCSFFMPFLNREDPFIRQQAARIIAKSACWSQQLMSGQDLQTFIVFLRIQLGSHLLNDYCQTTARCLQMLVRIQEYRRAFVDLGGLKAILTALETNPDGQVHYQLIFCLWCLSFDLHILSQFTDHPVVKSLIDVLCDAQKEKIIRVALATLRNLLETPMDKEQAEHNASLMINHRILGILATLTAHKFADSDIFDDVNFLTEHLETFYATLSSHGQCVAELKSGLLNWSPVHKCDKFWRENVLRFNDGNYALLRILVRLLEISNDPLVLCVAVHDVGQYIRYFPAGKVVLDRLHGKDHAMNLMSHNDPNVRYQALVAVQKVMVQNWEFLGRKLHQEDIEDQEGSEA